MTSKVRVRIEMAVALCAGILGVLTIFWHDWIETLTGWDPDQHNGSVEWMVVGGLLAVAVVVGLVARGTTGNSWRLVPGRQHISGSQEMATLGWLGRLPAVRFGIVRPP